MIVVSIFLLQLTIYFGLLSIEKAIKDLKK